MSSSSRINGYKNKGKGKDMKAKRAEVSVELRKAHRSEQLSKRRNFKEEMEEEAPSTLPTSEEEERAVAWTKVDPSTLPPAPTLEKVIQDLESDDLNTQLMGCADARKLLNQERNPRIAFMVTASIVSRLVDFLDRFDCDDLQYEAAWVLTNISAGTTEQTMEVVRAGAVPKLVQLLHSQDSVVVDQAVWALGNIAGDGHHHRDLVLECDAMPALLKALSKPYVGVAYARSLVWAVSNLCRNKNPPPIFELVQPCLPVLCQLLDHSDHEVLADTCWAISYLTDASNEQIQMVIQEGIVPPLVKLLRERNTSIVVPAIRAVGNIVTGNDVQTECVLNEGLLWHIKCLLCHGEPLLVKEAAWTLSNITAGNQQQIQKVIDSCLLPPLRDVLIKGDHRSQREVAWAVANFTAGGTVQQIALLVQMDFVKPMCDLIVGHDWKLSVVILDGLYNILQAAEQMNEADKVALLIEECGGLDHLETLQQHCNTEVYNKAVAIIDRFFREDDVEKPLMFVPISDNGELNFDVPSPSGTSFSF